MVRSRVEVASLWKVIITDVVRPGETRNSRVLQLEGEGIKGFEIACFYVNVNIGFEYWGREEGDCDQEVSLF